MNGSWQLAGVQAALNLVGLSARLDLVNPAAGLTDFAIGSVRLPEAQLMAVNWSSAPDRPCTLTSAYVRGGDLIANYGVAAEHPFHWEVYWRVQSHRYAAALAAIELIVSVQTNRLDSQPELTVTSHLPAAKIFRWRPDSEAASHVAINSFGDPSPSRQEPEPAVDGVYFGFELPVAGAMYVEMVHPGDDHSTSIRPASNSPGETLSQPTRMEHRLFARRLEKGVILRSRVLGLVLPVGISLREIGACFRTFSEEELPLTT